MLLEAESQEIHRLNWRPKVHNCGDECTPLVPIVSQIESSPDSLQEPF